MLENLKKEDIKYFGPKNCPITDILESIDMSRFHSDK